MNARCDQGRITFTCYYRIKLSVLTKSLNFLPLKTSRIQQMVNTRKLRQSWGGFSRIAQRFLKCVEKKRELRKWLRSLIFLSECFLVPKRAIERVGSALQESRHSSALLPSAQTAPILYYHRLYRRNQRVKSENKEEIF